MASGVALRCRGLVKRYARRHRRRRPRPRGAPRRVLRPARAQRRGQDHDHRDPRGPAGAGRRRGGGARPALGPRRARSCASGSASSCRRRSSARSSRSGDSFGCSAPSTQRGRAVDEVLRPRGARRRSATPGSASSRAARSSGSPWPARWSASRSCCSSTSRRPASTRSRGGSCGRCSSAFRAEGGTILLTTHYMDEAELLCDRIAIVDRGQVIALGTPRELIASLGAEHVVEFALRRGATPASPTTTCARCRACSDVRRAGGTLGADDRRSVPATLPALLESARAVGRPAGVARHPQRHARGRVRLADRDGTCAMAERARAPARRADPRALPRVPARARGDVLGLRLPGAAGAARSASRSARRRRSPCPWASRAGAGAGGARRSCCGRDATLAVARGRPARGGARAAQRRRAPGDRAGHAADLPLRPHAAREPAGAGSPPTRRCSARAGAHDAFVAGRADRGAAGLPLHRLGGARAARHEHHGHRAVGHRLLDRQARTRKLLKRLVATPMRRSHYLLRTCCRGSIFLALEVGHARRLRRVVFGTPRQRRPGAAGRRLPGWARSPSAASACWWRAARRRSRPCRA